MTESYINICCNNDVLRMIFEYISKFDLLTTIPFVCRRWRNVAKRSPLTFSSIKGWAFAIPECLLNPGLLHVSILSGVSNKECIPFDDLSLNKMGLHKYIISVYWFNVVNESGDNAYILGTMKFDTKTPEFYFALQSEENDREIIIHSDLFELLTRGTSDNFKTCMKISYFDKLKKTSNTKIVKPKYKSYRNNFKKRFASSC